jgi:hypothetical protein
MLMQSAHAPRMEQPPYMHDGGASFSGGIVKLDVGGTLFSTTHSTLSAGGDTMLRRMLDSSIPTTAGPDGRIFVDRDGERFRQVLNFLRDGSLPPGIPIEVLEALSREANFFCIDSLAEHIAERLKEIQSDTDGVDDDLDAAAGGSFADGEVRPRKRRARSTSPVPIYVVHSVAEGAGLDETIQQVHQGRAQLQQRQAPALARTFSLDAEF